MTAIVLALTVLVGMTPNFSDEITAHEISSGASDGVVNTYGAMTSPMGLDLDPGEGWLWQASENSGAVYTVDPATGVFTERFNTSSILGATMDTNGVYFDPTTNYVYLADYNGDLGVNYYDAVYCLDVTDPDNPVLVDVWDFGTSDGILGITYKAPYFYCNFYSAGEMRAYTLDPGGSFTLEDFWPCFYGGIWYHETWNVFYTHDALGTTVRVLDGDDPGNVLDSYDPGCTLTCGLSPDPDPAYLWTSDFYTDTNIQFDDEYVPAVLENSTWGSIKTAL